MAVCAQALQVDQAVAGALNTLAHEMIGLFDIGGVIEHAAMRVCHRFGNALERFAPAVIAVRIGKARINPRLAGFLVLQQ